MTTPNEANALLKSGRFEAAYAACEPLLAAAESPAVLAIAARALIGLGRNEEARALLARQRDLLDGIEARPRDFFDLGMALRLAGATEEACDALAETVRLRQDVPLPFAKYAEVLLELGRHEQAGEAARQGLALGPKHAAVACDLAVVLQRTGNLEAACAGYQRAHELSPEWTFPFSNWALAQMELGAPGKAAEIAARWLELKPGNIPALSFQAMALAEMGDAGADALLDFDRFVKILTIDVPDGYASMDAFNAALEAEVLAHPTLRTPDENHPTYHDPHLQITAELLDRDTGAVADLARAMRDTVARYFEGLDDADQHPFIVNRPQAFSYTAWAAVLDRQGNQHQHIHETGYLSGCYYVRIPPEVRDQPADANGDIAGGFEVGRPPDEFRCARPPRVRQIKPEPGMMVLFPAYMFHRTIPFSSNQQRISIAFDVMAAN